MPALNLWLEPQPTPPAAMAADHSMEPGFSIGSAGGAESGHVILVQDGDAGWGRVGLAAPVADQGDWPSAVTTYSGGLNIVSFSTDNIGGWIRWNPVVNPRAIIISHLGGGGAGNWWDDRGANGWATFLAANPDIMLVGVKYYEFLGSYNYYIGKARQYRRSTQGTTMRAVGRRVLEVLRWIDRELGGSNTPLVLHGASFGVDAILQPFYRADPMVDRVKLFAPLSYYPGWDLAAACAEVTPTGTWVDPDTGNIGTQGAPYTVGAAFRVGNDQNARQVLNAIWAVTSGGCLGGNPSTQQVEQSSGYSQMDLVNTQRYTGRIWAWVGTSDDQVTPGNDNVMGSTWAQANMLKHQVFEDASAVTWVNDPTLKHGEIWTANAGPRTSLFAAIDAALADDQSPELNLWGFQDSSSVWRKADALWAYDGTNSVWRRIIKAFGYELDTTTWRT
jgi:hypothetical protein